MLACDLLVTLKWISSSTCEILQTSILHACHFSQHQWCQAITNHDNLHENMCWVAHTYLVGDLVAPYPSRHSQKTCQTHSCTLPIDWWGMPTCQWYSHAWFESFPQNIQHSVIDSIKPHQNHWGHDLSYHMPHHIIFLLVIMIHTSGLSSHMLTLLENPFTFFTNTCHPLQCYHCSMCQARDRRACIN
jgi:hypothetical protein